MRQGTTPLHPYTLPINIPEDSEVRIIYAQENIQGEKKVLFVKTGADVTISGNTVSTRLTQSETFKVDPDQRVLVQVRVCLPDGTVPDFNILTMSAEECLEDYIMGGAAAHE